MDSTLAPENRRTIAKGLMQVGFTAARAAIAVDLAAQACDQANDAFLRALRLAPDAGIGLAATQIGTQVLINNLTKLLEGTVELAESHGLPRAKAEVHL